MGFSSSRAYLERDRITVDPSLSRFQSLQGRLFCIKIAFKKLLILPAAFLYKVCRTVFKTTAATFSIGLLFLTLGVSDGVRDFFVQRFCSLALDLADWILFPFAILICFSKLLLASTVHPALLLRF